MDEILLEKLIRDNLSNFQKADINQAINAKHVRKALKLWDKGKSNIGFLIWWKKQDLQYIAALHSYASWLGITGKMEFKVFEEIDQILLPASRSWRMPVVVTSGSDQPIITGGFLGRVFSIFQYQFSPAPNNELAVMCQEEPVPAGSSSYTLDFILDFLSFLVNKGGEGFLGFRQIPSRKWVSSENALTSGSMGPEEQIRFPDYDFTEIENALKYLELEGGNQDSFLARLLHVRHRAILEGNLENRLITLWAFIEDLWAADEPEDKLLTTEELDIVKNALNNISLPAEKRAEIVNLIPNLKKVTNTKHAKITKQIVKLECGKGWDIEQTRKLHRQRSKFAHGNSMKPDEERIVQYYISFLVQVINELITVEFSKNRINV